MEMMVRVISRKFLVFVCSGWLIYSLAVPGLVVNR